MKLDPVDQKALKGPHKDAKDKDINNDGKVDGSDEYLHNRRQAVSKAIGKLKEEAEELDELSKNTVRSYYNKAGEQGSKIAGNIKVGGGDWSKDGENTKTLVKRAAGRAMALKRRSGEVKMSEEVEELDELSKKTLGSYRTKAARDDKDRSKGRNISSAKMYPDQYKNSPLKAKVSATEEADDASTIAKHTKPLRMKLSQFRDEE